MFFVKKLKKLIDLQAFSSADILLFNFVNLPNWISFSRSPQYFLKFPLYFSRAISTNLYLTVSLLLIQEYLLCNLKHFVYLYGGSIHFETTLMLHHLSFLLKHQVFLKYIKPRCYYLIFDDFPLMHVEVFEFPLVKLHEMLVLLCSLPLSLFIIRVDIDDFARHLIPQQMHLLLVFVHEVTHIDSILQIVVVLLLMVYQNFVYQLICFFLVEGRNLFARGRKDSGVKVN